MARKRNRKDDNEFRLEEENRLLKSLNRSLLKQLKKLNKGVNRFNWSEIEPIKDELSPTKEIEIEDRPDTCQNCKRGTLKIIDLGIKTIKTCEICQYRSKPTNK